MNVNGVFKGINKPMTVEKQIVTADFVNQVKCQRPGKWGFWAPGPVLKCWLYIQVWSGPQIREKIAIKNSLLLTVPRRETCHIPQGHRQDQQGQSRGKGVNLRNKHSLSPISLSHLCTYRPFLSDILWRNLEIYSFTFKCIRIYFLTEEYSITWPKHN